MKVGFTGTQKGMTEDQKLSFLEVISRWNVWSIKEFHHGDCIGADCDAHCIVMMKNQSRDGIIVHPPISETKRAWCNGEEIRVPLDYLVRNRNIVNESDLLIAIPKGYKEELRSGTWSTVRYARKMGKSIVIIYPDGTTVDEKEG